MTKIKNQITKRTMINFNYQKREREGEREKEGKQNKQPPPIIQPSHAYTCYTI